MAGKSGGLRRLAAAHAAANGLPFEEAYARLVDGHRVPLEERDHSELYFDETPFMEGESGEDADSPLTLQMILAWDGNLAELLDDEDLAEIGIEVVREYEIDCVDRKEWLEGARKAQEAAMQKPPGKKMTPFEGASNVKYPLLTTAAIQFAARAYPAIVRGDEVIQVKPLGDDPQGVKAKRADRTSAFANDQLIYQCPEWELGTDAILHALPTVGAAFRKVYWDTRLNRPRFDYVSALDVVMPMGVAMEMAPRVTHEIDKFPYEIESLTRGDTPMWLPCDYQKDSSDSQKKERFLEQCRYIDLDEDDLCEPYVVTVHEKTKKVVRIEPAFDVEDVKTDAQGRIVTIERVLPWIDYCFFPSPDGSGYGLGFGQLLAPLSDVIDTAINQLVDAGTWANSNTGFLSALAKVRGGTMALQQNAFQMLPGTTDVRQAIYRMEFPGPNATLFNLLEFLISTAKDITSVKDVLTGDAPGTQPATSTLALIEQGLQVFSAIYKRIYRSMTREFELMFKLNGRYLADEVYQRFLDQQPPEPQVNAEGPAPIGHNGGPPMTPQDMGAPPPAPAPPSGLAAQSQGVQQAMAPPQAQLPQMPAPQAPPQAMQSPMQPPQQMQPSPAMMQQAMAMQLAQAQAQRPTAAQDFNPDDLDIRPVADPTAVTEMQRLAKAQFLLQFKEDPTMNAVEINKRAMEAARMPDIDKLIVERNPLMELQAQAQAAAQQAQAEAAKWEAAFKQAQAQHQGPLMQAQTDLYEAQAREAGAPKTAQQPPAAPHEVALAQAQTAVHMANADAIQRKTAIEEHRAAMDEAKVGMDFELQHGKHANDAAAAQAQAHIAASAEDNRNTLERLKLLTQENLSRSELEVQLRKIVEDSSQRSADRAQLAKDNAADRASNEKIAGQKVAVDKAKVAAAKARPASS